MKTRVVRVYLFFWYLILSSCAQGIDRVKDGMNAEDIINIADEYKKEEKYQYAGEIYLEIDRLYRYSDLARNSLISAAKSFHASGNYEMCRFSSKRFLDDFPESRDAAQAKYLIGLCYYEQIPDISRDQRPAKEALKEFTDLIERYPDSNFVPKAREKFEEALSQMAGQELEIGKYYMEKDQVLAAIGRFKTVIERYSMTAYDEEALFRIFEAYSLIGLENKSKIYLLKLKDSYPDSYWLTKAGKINGI